MRKISLLLSAVFIAMNANAAVNVASLIKLTPTNHPKCVEYYTYKGEAYCSTTMQSPRVVDPNIKDYEKQQIVFDDRAWQAAWGKNTPTITTLEYVPMGDDILHWKELVTSQFIPAPDSEITPEQYAAFMLENLTKQGFRPKVTVSTNTPDQVIFEWQIFSPAYDVEDELQNITKTKDGFYILHYVIKKADMGKNNRDKWLANLKNSKIKK